MLLKYIIRMKFKLFLLFFNIYYKNIYFYAIKYILITQIYKFHFLIFIL